MRTFYILFFTLSLVLSCCGLKSDSDSEHRKDTVIYFDDGIFWPRGIRFPKVEILDKDLYAQTIIGNGSYNLYIYDTFRGTVVDLFYYKYEKYSELRLNDSDKFYKIQRTEFVEDFINTYYNQYPLTDKGYKNIGKIIFYSLFYYSPWFNSKSYKDVKNKIQQPFFIVDSCFVNDTLTKTYKVNICDTIENRKAKVELRYQNNQYKFIYEIYYNGKLCEYL